MFRSEEQSKFHQLVARHAAEPDHPLLLEGGTGLGKTRAYLKALADSTQTAAIVLPTHQLIDQLLDSDDLQQVGLEVTRFRPATMFDTRTDYLANKDAAMAARVMVCTSASVMIDQRLRGEYNGVTDRDYLVFDEADQLPEAAALQRDLTIREEDLRIAGVRLGDIRETLETLSTKKAVDAELRGWSRIMLEALDEKFWFQRVGKDDAGGIRLYHHLPGRLLRRISNRPNVVFISATLSIGDQFTDFQRSMGIDTISRFSDRIEPTRHGDLSLNEALDNTVEEVIARAERPCLVVTTSFDASKEIAQRVPEAVLRDREETTARAMARLTEDGVLIAAAAWAGLDTPVQWGSIVIPKVPYGNPVELDDHIESRYIDSKNIAIRRMRQVVGRGLRHPEARCTIYILDERYKKLGRFLPKRFPESWVEGRQTTVVLSLHERSELNRKRVLEDYGVVCLACGLKPAHPRVIEVHHLDPIAEGERTTTPEDLIPLCRNCHALAHTKDPPMPLDELKAYAKQMSEEGKE